MTDRLNRIFSALPECDTFADIGCDHGYMAKAMLKSQKAKRVIVSDISAKCLKKAEDLLSEEIALGTAKSVVSNGFERVGECDLALIAGMGGEEIIKILAEAKSLPSALVLQPMKNVDKARVCAVELGYKIEKDYIFKSGGKFYDLLVLVKGKDSLTPEEIEFGRTNIKELSLDFKEFLQVKAHKLKKLLEDENLSERVRVEVFTRLENLNKYVEI